MLVGLGMFRFGEMHFAAAFVSQLGSLIADTNHASIQRCAITTFMHTEVAVPIKLRTNDTDTCYTADSLVYPPLTSSSADPPRSETSCARAPRELSGERPRLEI